MIKICIACHKPPIPVRNFDYAAFSPDYDPSDPILAAVGHGATREEAIEDYLAAIDAPEGAQWEEV
jgi:hypothetical protein